MRGLGLPIFGFCHVLGHLDPDLLTVEELDQQAHPVTAFEGGVEDRLVSLEGTALDLNGVTVLEGGSLFFGLAIEALNV